MRYGGITLVGYERWNNFLLKILPKYRKPK